MEKGSHTRLCPGRATSWRADVTEDTRNAALQREAGLSKAFVIPTIAEGSSRTLNYQLSTLILAVLLLGFSPTTHATTTPDGSAYILAASPGIDGLDCITAYDADEAPLQICEDSSDPQSDLDEISLPEENKAVIPSRDDQTTPQFSTTAVNAIALHQPGIIPAFLFSTHSSFFLREHIRERAPPSLT